MNGVAVQIEVHIDFSFGFALSYESSEGLYFREDFFSATEKKPIEVNSHQSSSIVAHIDSVRVEHGNDFDDQISLFDCSLSLLRVQNVFYNAFSDPGRRGLSRMSPCIDDHVSLIFSLAYIVDGD
jgi:hypothetical protein